VLLAKTSIKSAVLALVRFALDEPQVDRLLRVFGAGRFQLLEGTRQAGSGEGENALAALLSPRQAQKQTMFCPKNRG